MVRIRVHSGTLGSIKWDGKPLKIVHGAGLSVVDAVTDEVLVMVTSLRVQADPTGLATVELTELADADGNPGRMSKGTNTFNECYDRETGDVRTVTSMYLLAGIEEVD